jgi:integrase
MQELDEEAPVSTWIDQATGRRHVGFMVKGQRVHRTLPPGATAGDAKQLEAELRAAIARMRMPVIPGDPPMMEILQLYAEHCDDLRSPGTAKYHAARLYPWAQKYRASQAKECAAAFIKDARKAYAPATINRTLGAMTKGLSMAFDASPKLIPVNYGQEVKRLPEDNEREVFLSVDQVQQLASHCSQQVATAIWVALLTGARRGEVCKIRAQDIGEDTISIPRSHTKTNKPKVVPIVPALRPHLKSLPLTINYEGVKSGFRRAREAVGLQHVHFHDLRHSCASILIGLGVDLYTVSKILGHASVQSTQRYAHLQVEQQRKALSKLGALVTKQKKSHRELHRA